MKFTCVVGDEPYLVDKAVQEEMKGVECPDFNLLRCEIFGNDVIDFLQAIPLFGEKRLAYLVVSDLSEAETLLTECVTSLPDHASILVVARNYDARKAFTKALEKKGQLKVCSKAQVIDRLVPIVQKMAADIGLDMVVEVMDEFLTREGYSTCGEVTLLTIQSDLRSLYEVFGEKPTKKQVASYIERHDVGNAFLVADMILRNDVVGLRYQANSLKGQEIPALCALLREYRLSYKAHYLSNKEMGVYRSPHKLTKDCALSGIQLITNTIMQLKTGAIPKSSALLSTFLRLAYDANF